MIIDKINNISMYKSLINYPKVIYDFIEDFNQGRIDIDSKKKIEFDNSNHNILVFEYETKIENLWESHKKHIDLHWLISGEEDMIVSPVENMKVTREYDDENDYMLLEGEGKRIHVNSGEFAMFFPDKAHQTGVSTVKNMVRKLILKIRMNEALI